MLELLEEVKLHHDQLLLDIGVALELIIDNVSVDGLRLVADRILHLDLTQEILLALLKLVFLHQ